MTRQKHVRTLSLWLVVALLVVGTTGVVSPVPVVAQTPESICELPEEERPDPLPEPIELCGTTTLIGSQPGVTNVYLPEDAEIFLEEPELAINLFGPNKDVNIEGDGAYVGFLLVSEGYLSGADGIKIFGGSLPDEFMSWDQWSFYERMDGVVGLVPGPTYTISAGNYRLYLLADETPLTVTLKLSRAKGNVEVNPTRAVSFDARWLTPRVSVQTVKNVYSAGDTVVLGQNNTAARAIWFNVVANTDTEYGSCGYPGEPTLPEIGYLPGCSGNVLQGSLHGFTSTPDTEMTSWGRLITNSGLAAPPGKFSQGWWYESPSLVDSVYMVAYWLSLD